MKRDMDLIRRILLTIEADEPYDEIPGVDVDVLIGHVELLFDAGLVEGQNTSTLAEADFRIDRITWAGHEFLDAARNESVWKTVRRQLKEKSLSVSLSILQQLLTNEVRRLTGLG